MPRGQRKSLEEKIQAKQELINALNIRIESEERELEELYEQKMCIRDRVRYVQNRINALLRKGTSYTSFYFPIRNSLFYQGMDKTTNSQGQITVLGDYKEFGDGAGPDMIVTQVNQGQITNYPYQITTEEQQTLTVAATHYQWLQPNMELDKDGDGKNDIVVWYCLSDLSDNAKTRKSQTCLLYTSLRCQPADHGSLYRPVYQSHSGAWTAERSVHHASGRQCGHV